MSRFRVPGCLRRPLLPLAIALSACTGDSTGPAPDPAVACDASGGIDHVADIGSGTWRAADSPHRVPATIDITGTLVIEPGSVVCAGADAALVIAAPDARIDARGTREAPIIFTALDHAAPWGGIHASAECAECAHDAGVISNARVELARQGIVSGAFTRVDSVHFRQIRCTAARVRHIARSRVDSAGLDGCAAVELGIAASSGGTDTIADVVIRASGGDGLGVRSFSAAGQPPGSLVILGGRIESSAGAGVRFAPQYARGNVSAARPVRVVGSGDVPVWAPLDAVAAIWPALADQDSLAGNAADTAVVWGHVTGTAIVLGPAIVWQTRSNFNLPVVQWDADSELRLAPGARLDLRTDLRTEGGRFTVGEINGADVTIRGAGAILLACEPVAPTCISGSQMVNAHLDGVQLTTHQRIVIEDVYATGVRLEIGGPASRVTGITVENGNGPAFILLSDVAVTRCAVRNNDFYGIIVYEGGANATINDCAIESNRNAGVWNVGPSLLNARLNWWGDPAGPLGPDGDGVQGNVNYTAFRSVPPAFGPAR